MRIVGWFVGTIIACIIGVILAFLAMGKFMPKILGEAE